MFINCTGGYDSVDSQRFATGQEEDSSSTGTLKLLKLSPQKCRKPPQTIYSRKKKEVGLWPFHESKSSLSQNTILWVECEGNFASVFNSTN